MKIVKYYGKFVSEKPLYVLLFSLIFTLIMLGGYSQLSTKSSNQDDMLPENIDVISALNLFNQEFGGYESAMIVVKINPYFSNSDEPVSVLDPRVVRFIDILTQKAQYISYATEVSSISKLMEGINYNNIKDYIDTPYAKNVVSEDKSIALIRINLREDAGNHAKEIYEELSMIIQTTEPISGVEIMLGGNLLSDPIIQELIGPDTSRTGMFSLIGILLILLIMFRSFKNSFLPLTTIIFGVMWAMGFVGLIGMGISPMSSGVISMIMGIGIDFGIQIMTRFKYELKTNEKKIAMQDTIQGVFMPMMTTTLAALIGFQAMTLGQLEFMGELGIIMSFGVTGSMLAAITIVPSLLMLFKN